MTKRKAPKSCESHAHNMMGYVQWHLWAMKLELNGIKQKQCEKCKLWVFPDEFNKAPRRRVRE